MDGANPNGPSFPFRQHKGTEPAGIQAYRSRTTESMRYTFIVGAIPRVTPTSNTVQHKEKEPIICTSTPDIPKPINRTDWLVYSPLTVGLASVSAPSSPLAEEARSPAPLPLCDARCEV